MTASKQENLTANNQDTAKNLQQQLEKLQLDINALIDVMAINQSILSQMAIFWGEVTVLEKVLIGMILIIPTLILGIIAEISSLIALSLATMLVYTTISILLDNHYQYSNASLAGLRLGIKNLASLLISVIGTFEIVKEQFSTAVNNLSRENKNILTNNLNLNNQVQSLSAQNAQLQKVESGLIDTQTNLELVITNLNNLLNEQTQLLKDTQTKLERSYQDCELIQTQLAEKILELDDVTTKLSTQIKQREAINLVLKGAVAQMSALSVADEAKQLIFQKKLEDFVNNKEASFDQIVKRISESERRLAEVSKELILNNQKFTELVDKQEPLLNQLEALKQQKINDQYKSCEALHKFGQFSGNNNNLARRINESEIIISKDKIQPTKG